MSTREQHPLAPEDYDHEDDDWGEEDEVFECGAWLNGKLDYCHCQLAGTEDCDWECPYSAEVRGLRK